ncbi:MAG TPA: hypothetical protein VI564_03910 [Candidatus Nanoarchaeia archaeon]|nr:hypothetical protein [Candidatus Nanoarchaeia archaeon]
MLEIILEPDVLITQIGDMLDRDTVGDDVLGLDVRMRAIECLFAEQGNFSSSGVPYDRKREHYIKTQGEILALAQVGYEQEALGFAARFIQMYADLIPLDKRVIEYQLRINTNS